MAAAGQYILPVCLLMLVSCFHFGHCIVYKKMAKSARCPDLVLVSRARSLVECVIHCQSDADCSAIVFDADSSLCHLGNASSKQNCSNMETATGNTRFYVMIQSSSSAEATAQTAALQLITTHSSTDMTTDLSTEPTTQANPCGKSMEIDVGTNSSEPCQNGGHLDKTRHCVCPINYTGRHCERFIRDCTEAMNCESHKQNGVYTIQPALSPFPFATFCQMLNNPRTFILNRRDPTFTFNRTWHDFREGFGDPSGNFWLGLDKIYQLTNSMSYELRFLLKVNGTAHYSFFRTFVLSNEASGYNLTIGDYFTPGVKDCMTELHGAKFSTYDADNDDNSATNCAAVFGGGWWYKGGNCSACNILGPLLSGNGQRLGILGEMFWDGFGAHYPFPLSAFVVKDTQ